MQLVVQRQGKQATCVRRAEGGAGNEGDCHRVCVGMATEILAWLD
jgi:hypothetical protein